MQDSDLSSIATHMSKPATGWVAQHRRDTLITMMQVYSVSMIKCFKCGGREAWIANAIAFMEAWDCTKDQCLAHLQDSLTYFTEVDS